MRLRQCAAVPVLVCILQTNAAAQSISLSLEDALARARALAPAVLVAKARIEEARGRLAGARVRFRENPAIEIGTGPRNTDAGTLTDLDVGFTQWFERGGQRAARMAAAEAGISREAADADEARRVALGAVGLAYLRTLHAQERIELLRRSEALAADVLATAERRNAAGDIAILDVNIAKIALARARAARMMADAERTALAGELQRLIGLPAGSAIVAAGALRRPSPPDLVTLLAAAGTRPDLRAMEADIRDAEADVRLARATSRPDIGLGARVKREEGHRVILGEVSVTLPLFNHGQELLAVGTARASRGRLQLETTRASIESEVRSLYAAFAVRDAALAAFDLDAMPGMDENDTLVSRSFDVGQISLPELLLVRRELVETRLEYLNRLLELAEAAIELDAAAGVLQ